MPDTSIQARRGNAAWVAGLPGFYVVNPETWISNSRPFTTRAAAEKRIAEIDAAYPGTPGVLRVVEIEP